MVKMLNNIKKMDEKKEKRTLNKKRKLKQRK